MSRSKRYDKPDCNARFKKNKRKLKDAGKDNNNKTLTFLELETGDINSGGKKQFGQNRRRCSEQDLAKS